MSLETVVLDHLPTPYTVHIALFRNVRNAAFLHSQLLARNPDFEYGLVDASIVCFSLSLCASIVIGNRLTITLDCLAPPYPLGRF